MFTIRIERENGTREVAACERYRVSGTSVDLFAADGGTARVEVGAYDRVFVMNADGNTVDQMVGVRRKAAMAG